MVKRQGAARVAPYVQDPGQITQAPGEVGMFFPQSGAPDFLSLAEELLGCAQIAHLEVHHGQVVQARGVIFMLLAVGSSDQVTDPAKDRFRPSEVATLLVETAELAQVG